MKRIFSRRSHDCLSAENKPKVVEVILKFAKLYEGVDFQDEEFLSQYFDHHLHLNFMNYNDRTPILKETFLSIVDGYN
jgi:hypothetical protein